MPVTKDPARRDFPAASFDWGSYGRQIRDHVMQRVIARAFALTPQAYEVTVISGPSPSLARSRAVPLRGS